MNDAKAVTQQYEQEDNLPVRLSLHDKYSVNPYGYHNWLFDQFELTPNSNILELGCGNGRVWQGHPLPDECALTLTDISEGMVRVVTEKYAYNPLIKCTVMDIQQIPVLDNTYDLVIANSMLYHVPDLPCALQEVRRVLKPGGTFFAATTGGKGSMQEYLHCAIKAVIPSSNAFGGTTNTFSLDNGADVLKDYFDRVDLRLYDDHLEITEVSDLIAWLRSTITLTNISEYDLSILQEYFEQKRDTRGVLVVPKAVGAFIAKKML